ncbi:MAG: serine hydrolase [Patescibacteria group bacterium]|nr:serine hydrolase [Patescibacteria group bacterium]
MKKYCVGILISIGIIGFIVPAKAEILTDQWVHLDQPTIEKGYTVSLDSQDLRVGIYPQTLAEPAWVNLRRLSTDEFQIPDGKKLVSEIFQYDIKVAEPKILTNPVGLTAGYDASAANDPEFYFYSRQTGQWHKVPAKFDAKTETVKTRLPFPFAQVAVLADDSETPVITSVAGIVVDKATGRVLFEGNADAIRPMASLTKMMTALVWLDHNPGFDKVVEMKPEDDAIGAKLYVQAGETLTVKDLLYTTLVGSANNTAKALARSTGLTTEEFVDEMNHKARELGMTNTKYTEPTGLDLGNTSTVRDLIKLSDQLLRSFTLSQITTTRTYTFTMKNTGRVHTIKNTNLLVNSDLYLIGGKTGYLDEAGYCLMSRARNQQNKEITAIILGSSTRSRSAAEVEELIRWGFEQ